MNLNYNEFKKSNNIVMYDGLREYCLCEYINEEHIRSTISKSGTWKYKFNIANLLIISLSFEKRDFNQEVQIERRMIK